MLINKSHLKFIQLVASGVTFEKAYATSCNKHATSGNARAQGSRFAKKYAKEIAEAQQKAKDVVQEANNTEAAQIALKQILTQAEVDKKLCDIIKGELIEVQQLNSMGKVFKAKITPTIAEQTKAIDLYNKRFGSNEAVKIDANISQMPAPNIILANVKKS